MTNLCNTTTGLLRVTLHCWLKIISLSYIDVDMNAINDVFCCDLIILEPQVMQFNGLILFIREEKTFSVELLMTILEKLKSPWKSKCILLMFYDAPIFDSSIKRHIKFHIMSKTEANRLMIEIHYTFLEKRFMWLIAS